MQFGQPRPRRKPSLTPMIDVVFLLLVFFMLAARFGTDTQMPLLIGGQGQDTWQGPPRLVDIAPDALRLNGIATQPEALAGELAALMDGPDDTIVLRPTEETPLQRVVAVMEALQGAGLTALVLVE